MTHERFLEIKHDFVDKYRDMLCDESMEDIACSYDWPSFVAVLRKYMAFNNYKPFPDAEWARKWFAADKQSINEEGIYLDQMVNVKNPDKYIMCYGDCTGVITITEGGRHYVMLQDKSSINLFMNSQAVVFVKLKGDARVWEMMKAKGSILKVRKYETTNGTQWS